MAATLKKSLLVATLDSLETPHYLSPAISSAAAATTDSLVIVLLSPLFDLVSRTQQWDDVQRILAHVYVQATKVAQDNGRILMDVSVLLLESFPPHLAAEADQCFVVQGLENIPIRNLPLSVLPRGDRVSHPLPVRPLPEEDIPPLYPVISVGGTFDHLHAGHKILLSMAAWITEKKLIIGVKGMGHSFIAYLMLSYTRRPSLAGESPPPSPGTLPNAGGEDTRLPAAVQAGSRVRPRCYSRRLWSDCV